MIAVSDAEFMRRALELARQAKGSTFPNPSVGAVLVQDGIIVGEGATAQGGRPHAETCALAQAGEQARGAVLYVTLEPCSHFGSTPPCAAAIIEAGVSRVLCAVGDPNPLVNGRGYAMLREAGIFVETGLMESEARLLNEDFFWTVQQGRPFVSLKLALTLDGRIADAFGSSKWISSEEARSHVHELRRFHAGIAVGSGTLQADDPELTVRHVPGKSPVRFVFSSDPDVGRGSRLRLSANETRSIIVCTGLEPGYRRMADDGVEIWGVGDRAGSIDMFLAMAFEDGLPSIFVEGGAALASSFIEAGRVNRLYLFYGNRILGGGRDGISLKEPFSMLEALRLEEIHHQSFGETLMVTGLLHRSDMKGI